VQQFNYSDYFHRVQEMKKIQVDAASISWLERYEAPTESHDVVLMLGCNILRTPHIARQVIRVFEHLNIDFVAVGGIQYCCGIMWDIAGDVKKGQGIAKRTISRLEAHGAPRVVMWCPACDVHFAEHIMGRDQLTPNFGIIHAAQFLSDLARESPGLPWQRSVNQKVVIHAHAGLDDHAEGQLRARRDREAVLTLLEKVPGLEILDVIVSDPAMDFDCGPMSTKMGRGLFPRDQFEQYQRDTIGKALDLGAEQIITISHACQREWCGENTGQLGFRNYISVVGEALGLPVDIDLLSEYRAAGSVQEIVDRSRVIWASHGMTEAEAVDLITRLRAEGDLTGYNGVEESRR
jgi:heterodisulfide reductase subunit D